jgi:hypothetical protein
MGKEVISSALIQVKQGFNIIDAGQGPARSIHRATAYRGLLAAAADPVDPMSATDAAWAIRRFGTMGDPQKSYITPGSIAAAAIGAGVGGAAGAALGQGIGFFFGASPKTKKRLTYGGAGLGALLSAARVIPNG